MDLRICFLTLIGALLLAPIATVAQVEATCEVGAWYPYQSNDGVPSPASFAARGMNLTFISGDIDASVLATYDVLFLGRTGMLGAAAIEDIDALIQWISDGGDIMGESNALIYDSDSSQAQDWSSRLSVVAGVSGGADGSDTAVSDPTITVTDAGHPITQGVSASFTLTGSHAQELSSALDTGKNPTAVQVATSNSNPIIAAQYGAGRSVYFPTAVGYGGMNWAANSDYENLFLNAAAWACDGARVARNTEPVPFMNGKALAILALFLLFGGLLYVRRTI